MPRITSRRKEYKNKDIGPQIAGKMKMERVTQCDMALSLGITQQALGQKIKKSQFTYADLITIFERLHFSDAEILQLMKI